jgi:predicted transcriptional regulator
MVGNPLTSLDEQLENHYHIEAEFDVKLHQDLLVIIAEYHGYVDMQQQLEETKVAATVVKYDHVDQKMSASVQCHLEFGFSSFKIKSMLDSSIHDHAMHACKLRL